LMAALHLELFEQPVETEGFSANLLSGGRVWQRNP
jgi:hypothetical protein